MQEIMQIDKYYSNIYDYFNKFKSVLFVRKWGKENIIIVSTRFINVGKHLEKIYKEHIFDVFYYKNGKCIFVIFKKSNFPAFLEKLRLCSIKVLFFSRILIDYGKQESVLVLP